MNYFKDFKVKVFLTRVFWIVFPAFVVAFGESLSANLNFDIALKAALPVAFKAFLGAIGFDQIMFNLFKQPEVQMLVNALKVQAQSLEAKTDKTTA